MTPIRYPAFEDDDDFDEDDEDDGERGWCDHCAGTGIIDCHCGGDLCICKNRGEIDCPHC